MSNPIQAEKEYRNFLEQGRLMLLRDNESGKCMFYPRVVAPGTGSTDLEWVEASGKGTVYSVTTVRQRPPSPGYNVSLIDLEEGPRMMARVEGLAPGDVKIGQKVIARFIQEDDAALVVFDPV